MSYQNDEVYLKQLLAPIKAMYLQMVTSVYLVIQFLIKKKWFILGLLIVGLLTGYFLDQRSEPNIITQEIIIEPQPNTTTYVYNFVVSISKKQGLKENLKTLGLQEDWIKNVKYIYIQPVIAVEDILNYLHDEYEDKNFQYTIQDFSEKELRREKFKYLYKQHKITFQFRKEEKYNTEITKFVLDKILKNDHFNNLISLKTELAKESLKTHKKSLQFIDGYLDQVNQNPNTQKEQELVIISSEKGKGTLAGLIDQRTELLTEIEEDYKIINAGDKVFSLVYDSGMLTAPEKLRNRLIIGIPFLLIFIYSAVYFFLFVYRRIKIMAN